MAKLAETPATAALDAAGIVTEMGANAAVAPAMAALDAAGIVTLMGAKVAMSLFVQVIVIEIVGVVSAELSFQPVKTYPCFGTAVS
jgi:hypothetical protein